MFNKKLALCTTADDKYIEYAIVSFESFRNHSAIEMDYFIVCNNISQKNINKLQQHNINCIIIDLYNEYNTQLDWPYPSECFWIFKCPELLYERGYEYTMCVDCDTYCNKPLNLDFLAQIQGIAGVDRGKTNQEFLQGIENISMLIQAFNLQPEGLQIKSMNSGVLIFNNEYWHKNKINNKMIELFKVSFEKGFPRKGDDSLLSLYLSLFDKTPIKYIDQKYNDYLFYNIDTIPENESIIIHYADRIKPWSTTIETSNLKSCAKYYIQKWINFTNEKFQI